MSATGRTGQTRCDAGFTLLELLVALAIMALVAGIAFPALQRRLAAHTLAEAQAAVRMALVRARAEAKAGGHPVQIAADPANPRRLLVDGRMVAALPDGASLRWTGPVPRFWPDGTTTGTAIEIRAGTATVHVDPVQWP